MYSTRRMQSHRQPALLSQNQASKYLYAARQHLHSTFQCQSSGVSNQHTAASLPAGPGDRGVQEQRRLPAATENETRERHIKQPQPNLRRQLLLHSFISPLLVPLVIGSDDATTIVNSVLSAYGLPTLKASAGFKLYDEFQDDCVFEYPRSWVSRPNTLRKGVYISDFKTADKVSVEELDLPDNGSIVTAAIEAAVYPGGNRLVEDATLTLPARRLIKTTTETVDGQEVVYLEFPSETTTRSGYNIRRKNFAAAAVKRGKLYTIAASARSDQYDEDKKQLLQHIVQSFRLR